jgi:restriction system protein
MDRFIDTTMLASTLWTVGKPFLPLLLILGLLNVLKEIGPAIWQNHKRKENFKRGGNWLNDQDLLRSLRDMTPTQFEMYTATLFQKLGYKTFVSGGRGDGGIDVVAEKEGVQHFIQCKKFITSEVGVGAVRDFYGAMAGKMSGGKGFFITTNKFSLDAERFAEDKPIELVDSFRLIKYIRMAMGNGFDSTPTKNTKKCLQCAGQLVERTSKFGKFFGCENYPSCKYTSKTQS